MIESAIERLGRWLIDLSYRLSAARWRRHERVFTERYRGPQGATSVERHRWSPPEGPRLEDGSFLSGRPAQRDRVLWGAL